jgi:hypothetical protein
VANRVAKAANAYLASELAEGKAHNALNRDDVPSAYREKLAEAAWDASIVNRNKLTALRAALSEWEKISHG